MTSQRYGSLIYVVTRPTSIFPNELSKITVFNWNHQGELELIKSLELSGSVGTVATFPDYFVLTSFQEGSDPQTTKVQIFALLSLPDPLVELPSIQIEGEIFSASHLNIFNQQLRVVYFSKEKKNTVVAIYDLSSPEITLVGKVDLISPEFTSSAPMFVGQYARIVS